MDPVRNPYAPGAGQRPPELAGRDDQLQAFDILLERVSRGRPERSIVLTGLRGVGKTVLLNAMRSAAVRRNWGTGKLEARPEQPLRRPLAAALHLAVRELSPRDRDGAEQVLGVLKSFALREDAVPGRPPPKLRERWQPGIDVAAVPGRADSGDIEIDLVELLTDIGGLAQDAGHGVAVFVDEMQDLPPPTSAPSAPPATRSARPACRSSSSVPACRTCPRSCRRASPTRSGCSGTPGSTGWIGPPPTARCARRRSTRTPTGPTTPSPRCTPSRAATPTSFRRTARRPGMWRRARRSSRTTCASRRPRPTGSSPSGSSGHGTSGPPRPSASTCERWPTWRRP